MDATFRKATKLILLFAVVAFLLLLPVLVADAANDVASSFQVNNSTVELTSTWTEYANISGFATGAGNTTVTISVNTVTNVSTARSYGRILRDGAPIASFNLSQSYFPETVTYSAPFAETEATHIYSFEAWCTAGKKCTLYNRTFSATFIKTGSYAASVTNVTTSYPFTSTYGATPEIGAPVASGSTGGYLDQTNWTKFNNTNRTVEDFKRTETFPNESIQSLKDNDTRFPWLNGTRAYSGNILPDTNGTRTIGNSTTGRWGIGWFVYLWADLSNATGLSIGQILNLSAEIDTKLNTTQAQAVWNSQNTTNADNDTYRRSNETAIKAAMALQNASQDANNTAYKNTFTLMNQSSESRDATINSTKVNKSGESMTGDLLPDQNGTRHLGNGTTGRFGMGYFNYLWGDLSNGTGISPKQVLNLTNELANKRNASEPVQQSDVHNLTNMLNAKKNNTDFDVTINAINATRAGNDTAINSSVLALQNNDSAIYAYVNGTFMKIGNITNCTGGTNRSNFNGTWFTCEVDQTSAFSFIVTGGETHTGSITATAGTGITFTDTGGVWTISSPAAGVTNATVDFQNGNASNLTSGQTDFNLRTKNVTVNVSTNVSGQMADANIANATTWNNKVGSVGGSGVIVSSGGVNPTVSCPTCVTNATVDFQSGNATNITSGTMSLSRLNYSRAYAYNSTQQDNIASDVQTLVKLDTKVYDTNNNFASNTFTVPRNGYYIIIGQVSWLNYIANKPYAVYIYKNGAVIDYNLIHSGAGTGNVMTPRVTTIQLLNAGDTIQMYAWNNDGAGTADVTFDGNKGTLLQVSELGAP